MRILLTNDDGLWAEGIKQIRRCLEEIAEVIVVAPEKQQSASGHGITIHKPLRAEKIHFKNSNSIGYAVNGTPSDCVKLAVQVLLKDQPPDLVVSGINLGPNLGTDILYSGTVSGALEGIINGVPAMAISLATHDKPNFNYTAKFGRYMVEKILSSKVSQDTLLNINVPGLSKKEIAGVSITRLGHRKYENVFETRFDPRGKEYYWLGGEVLDVDKEPETDIYAIQNGFISITPIQFDLTNYKMMDLLNNWSIVK